jgi:membrane-bound serine protease (ClpP class)
MAQALPIVEILLVVLGVALLVLELKVPGSFVFAGVAAVLFLLFFWAQAALGAPLIGLGLALFLLGLALVGIELTVLPSHVVPGVVGLLLILAGLVVAGLDRVPADAGDWKVVGIRALWTGLTVAGGCVLAAIAARHLSHIPIANRLVLVPPADRSEGESDVTDPAAGLLGETGLAISLLGFAGMARIAGRRVDVVTEGEFIPPGVAVRVVAVDGHRVVVKRA